MPVQRHSSLHTDLSALLTDRLHRARRYLRIAGYFRSSLLEIAGEALAGVEEIRVVCNAELDPHDVRIARAARGGQALAKAIVARWQEDSDGLDTLLLRDRYRRLYDLLASQRMTVRVLSTDVTAFLHGKAGVIEFRDGGSTAFVGSVNESRAAWRHNYEILWEDDAPDAAAWVRRDFEHFWERGVDLPDAVIRHIGVMARRSELNDIADWRDNRPDPAPALAERPLYRAGNVLRPWQKRFVSACLEQQRLYGQARYLIADDVGLGKTLSMGAATLVLSLLVDKPVLILAPSTLVWQWQTELADMLGLPSCVWSTQKKCWIDPQGFPLSGRGPEHIARCPMRIGIVSTGLIVNGAADGEKARLAQMSFGVLVLDEAHKARARRDRGGNLEGYNNLLAFMREAARRAGNVILGTATPIQLNVVELWDLQHLLAQGAPHVLGTGGSPWLRADVMDCFTAARPLPTDPVQRWELLKNPLAPAAEDGFYRAVRQDAALADHEVTGPLYRELPPSTRDDIDYEFQRLFAETNPIIRHTVRRSRQMLEERGLLKPIRVTVHPQPGALPPQLLDGNGLRMGWRFEAAYAAAQDFCKRYAAHRPAAGFMKTILLRRIGSSVKAGLDTAQALLRKGEADLDPEETDDGPPPDTAALDPDERTLLAKVRDNLDSLIAGDEPDPKAEAVIRYLRDHGWLELGSVIFSQYFDTAEWIAGRLVAAFPGEPVALYAGGGRSFVYMGDERRHTVRETIKRAVQSGDIRLLVATDAACEGLNLQRLGTQINIDLPWNPSRLEQRKGRIQRIGQPRDGIEVMNLRYAGTVEDDVYEALSERLQDIFEVLGQLPDSFEEDWVDAVLRDRASVRHFATRAHAARPPMERRYFREVADDAGLDWEFTDRVIAARDIEEYMRKPWS